MNNDYIIDPDEMNNCLAAVSHDIMAYNNTLIREIRGRVFIDTMKSPAAFLPLLESYGYLGDVLYSPPKGHPALWGNGGTGFKIHGVEFHCHCIEILP